MAARPLSEVYAGSLSRNWPKLLEILEAGENRVIILWGKGESQYADNAIEFWSREDHHYTKTLFERFGIGFFPANDDEK